MNGYYLQLVYGLEVTLTLAAAALLLGVTLGLLGAAAGLSRFAFLRNSVGVLVSFIRALPELLILFFIYYGGAEFINALVGHYVNISPFVAGVIALGVVFGAYATQVFHGALMAVSHHQIEAAAALGFSNKQIFFLIYLPQAWRHALPGLGNLWVTLLKDTSIVTLIGLTDMMNATKLAAAATGQPFNWYLLVSGIYLFITSTSEWLLKRYTSTESRSC
jgi:His/Glu/Gln/Arg/opine family amino acid ABC transporter permease subunit